MTYEQNLSYGMSYIKAVRGSSWAGETRQCAHFPIISPFLISVFSHRSAFNSVATKAIEVRLLAAAGASVDAPADATFVLRKRKAAIIIKNRDSSGDTKKGGLRKTPQGLELDRSLV